MKMFRLWKWFFVIMAIVSVLLCIWFGSTEVGVLKVIFCMLAAIFCQREEP